LFEDMQLIRKLKFSALKKILEERLQKLVNARSMDETNMSNQHRSSHISGALMKSLCLIRSKKEKKYNLHARVLVLQVSPDDNSQYNAIVNSIFAAQKMKVLIDSISIGKEHSVSLDVSY